MGDLVDGFDSLSDVKRRVTNAIRRRAAITVAESVSEKAEVATVLECLGLAEQTSEGTLVSTSETCDGHGWFTCTSEECYSSASAIDASAQGMTRRPPH